MVEKDKPSSIHSTKSHKLTRRRLLNELSVAGFSCLTASLLTVEDVRAADSDEIPIALDLQGNSKVMVDTDWYDWLHRARKVRSNIRSKWLNHRNVKGIWLTSGGSGGENPFIEVELDKYSNSKENTRGDLPERKNDVRIKVTEMGYRSSLEGACGDSTACSNYHGQDLSPEIYSS